MRFFNRKEKSNKDTTEKKDKEINPKMPKVKIGFRHRKKEIVPEEKRVETEPKPVDIEDNLPEEPESEDKEDEIIKIQDELLEEEPDTTKKDEGWSTLKKKRRILSTDLKGKSVFLEDTGEKLGTVFDIIYDGEKRLIGYKIKDNRSESVLSFPIDQFDESKEGLIFIQSWYTNSLKTLEKLEFKERISPELTTLIGDDTISIQELYNIFVKHDDQMANYIEEAVSLKELLYKRLGALEKQRLALKDSLIDLTEKRLIKDIDRKEFSEDVMKHRRKVNVLDVNINKCKELLKRLDSTSFGKLGTHIVSHTNVKDKNQYFRPTENTKSDNSFILANEIDTPYKQKYDDIKELYEKLTEDYNELKTAVEKLIAKGEQ